MKIEGIKALLSLIGPKEKGASAIVVIALASMWKFIPGRLKKPSLALALSAGAVLGPFNSLFPR